MKMTMNVDGVLLGKAMALTGAASKTAAIDLALRELVRRGEVAELARAGLGLSADELKEVFDPNFDPDKLRKLEAPVTYERKPSARR